MLRLIGLVFVLAIGVGAMTEKRQSSQEKLFSRAKIVRLLAEKGERISAGPLTLLIDPLTHKPCKSVIADPAGSQLIPAIYRLPGTDNRVALYLIRPVPGTADRAVLRGSGSETLSIIPDKLGNRDIKDRNFWLESKVDNRRHIRKLGYYEIVAYTAGDVFSNSDTGSGRGGGYNQAGWSDSGGGSPQTAPASGYAVNVGATPPQVTKGQVYEVPVIITVFGVVKMKLLITLLSQGLPSQQSQTVDLTQGSQTIAFKVTAQKDGTEESHIQFVEIAIPGKPQDSIGIADAKGLVDASGVEMNSLPPGVSASKGTDGLYYIVPAMTVGAGATALIVGEIKRTDGSKTTIQTEVHIDKDDAVITEDIVARLKTTKGTFTFDSRNAEDTSKAPGLDPKDFGGK